MIDLHCHILPALDNGARDLDDSVAMARGAAADGIEAICATPHIRHDHDVRIHEVAARIEVLNARLREETGAGMRALAEAGLVHVLGSDSHTSLLGRQARLAAAFEALRESARVAPHVEWMAETAPRAIVAGDEVDVPFAPAL